MKEYFIPHNFKDNGKIFGCFEKRAFYYALCWLIASLILLIIIPLPLPFTQIVLVKIFCGIILIAPSTLLIAFGFTDVLFYMYDFQKRAGVYRQRDTDGAEEGIVENKESTVVKRNKKFDYSDFVPIKRLVKGIVQLHDGNYVHMLEVEPINFRLKSVTEREGIIIGFHEFL